MRPDNPTRTLDAKGLLCPMPVVRANKVMQELNAGDVLEILATDKGSKTDIPAWSADQGHTLLHAEDDGKVFRYYVRKGNGA